MSHTHLTFKSRDINNTPAYSHTDRNLISEQWKLQEKSFLIPLFKNLRTFIHYYIYFQSIKKVIELYSYCLFRLALAPTHGMTGPVSHTYTRGDIPIDEWELHERKKLSGIPRLFAYFSLHEHVFQFI